MNIRQIYADILTEILKKRTHFMHFNFMTVVNKSENLSIYELVV